MDEGRVAIDEDGQIFAEYRRRLSPSGQPGVGDGFFQWLLVNQGEVEKCAWTPIHAIKGSDDDFEEFPRDPRLENFDRSDRKFVAVSVAHPEHPPILVATDSDWWAPKEALKDHGITVIFLCPDYIESVVEKKKK